MNYHTPIHRRLGTDSSIKSEFSNEISQGIERTRRAGILSNLSSFSTLFEIPINEYQSPVIASSMECVGSKLTLAYDLKQYQTLGIDLVALCVNDLLPSGALPVFFQDYISMEPWDLAFASEVMKGITKACLLAGVSLVDGKIHEMPRLWDEREILHKVEEKNQEKDPRSKEHGLEKEIQKSFKFHDLAGFAVGWVDRANLLGEHRVKSGDLILGLPSSGPHCHGYSLIYRLILEKQIDLHQSFGHQTLAEALLMPTRIYVNSLVTLFKENLVAACAPVKRGGLETSFAEIIPKNLQAIIDLNSFELPALFDWIQKQANISTQEMLNIFNCGVGMVLIVDHEKRDEVLTHLRSLGEQPWFLGYIQSSNKESRITFEGKFQI